MRQIYVIVAIFGPLWSNLKIPGLTLNPACFVNSDGKRDLSIITQTQQTAGHSYRKEQEVRE